MIFKSILNTCQYYHLPFKNVCGLKTKIHTYASTSFYIIHFWTSFIEIKTEVDILIGNITLLGSRYTELDSSYFLFHQPKKTRAQFRYKGKETKMHFVLFGTSTSNMKRGFSSSPVTSRKVI